MQSILFLTCLLVASDTVLASSEEPVAATHLVALSEPAEAIVVSSNIGDTASTPTGAVAEDSVGLASLLGALPGVDDNLEPSIYALASAFIFLGLVAVRRLRRPKMF